MKIKNKNTQVHKGIENGGVSAKERFQMIFRNRRLGKGVQTALAQWKKRLQRANSKRK